MLELSDSLQNYTALTMLSALFFAAAAILAATSHTVRKRQQKTFVFCFVALMFIVAADWFNNIFNGVHPEFRYLHVLLTCVMFSIAPGISILIAQTIVPSKHFKWAAAILIAHAVFEIGNLFFGYVFWVDEANAYYRGPLYIVYAAMYGLSVIYLVVESALASRVYQSRSIAPMVATVVCLASGVIGQIVNTNVRTSWLAVGMAVLLYYLYYSDVVLRTDALTRLLNRRSYQETMANPPLPCAVVLLDIDDFKVVNDTFGHSFGDTCLITIASLIRQAFGESGRCFRTGGDEFVVIVTKNPSDVGALSRSFANALGQARAADVRIPSVSVGYAVADAGCADIAGIVDAADKAMYGTKRAEKHSAALGPTRE